MPRAGVRTIRRRGRVSFTEVAAASVAAPVAQLDSNSARRGPDVSIRSISAHLERVRFPFRYIDILIQSPSETHLSTESYCHQGESVDATQVLLVLVPSERACRSISCILPLRTYVPSNLSLGILYPCITVTIFLMALVLKLRLG